MKKYKTVVVLIPVDYNNSRKVCEHIQNCKFESDTKARQDIYIKLGEDVTDDTNDIIMYDLNDFMDEVNDQNLDNLSDFFMSYIEIETIK